MTNYDIGNAVCGAQAITDQAGTIAELFAVTNIAIAKKYAQKAHESKLRGDYTEALKYAKQAAGFMQQSIMEYAKEMTKLTNHLRTACGLEALENFGMEK